MKYLCMVSAFLVCVGIARADSLDSVIFNKKDGQITSAEIKGQIGNDCPFNINVNMDKSARIDCEITDEMSIVYNVAVTTVHETNKTGIAITIEKKGVDSSIDIY